MAFDVGDVIQAAGDLYAGHRNREVSRREARLNRQLQKEFAQHGIRWRVEDAQAAGVHPLYAMGAQLPSYSPVVSGENYDDFAQAGQSLARAVSAGSTRQERVAQRYALMAAQKGLEETDARVALLKSEEALNRQRLYSASAVPTMDESEAPAFRPGAVTVKPSEVPTVSAGDPSVQAGQLPSWRRFQLNSSGDFILLPAAENTSEAFEAIQEGAALGAMILQHNRKVQGDSWLDYFTRSFLLGQTDREIADARARKFKQRRYVERRLKSFSPQFVK